MVGTSWGMELGTRATFSPPLGRPPVPDGPSPATGEALDVFILISFLFFLAEVGGGRGEGDTKQQRRDVIIERHTPCHPAECLYHCETK